MKSAPQKEKLIRVTALIPKKKLRALMGKKGKRYTQSEVLRMLIDNELERIRSWKAHQKLYGIANPTD